MNLGFVHRADLYSKAFVGLIHTALTAGGAGDNTEVNGASVDRKTGGVLRHNATLVILHRSVLAAAATLSISVQLQDSPDNTNWTDFGDAHNLGVVSTGGGGGSTEIDVEEIVLSVAGAERYIRAQVTPNLSAANTDTSGVAAIWMLSGGDKTPA